MFLSNTLNGIIKRFEDEFPDTRVSSHSADSAIDIPDEESESEGKPHLPPGTIPKIATTTPLSDEDEPDPATPTAIKSPCLSRSNSLLSLSSKALAHEEGRILRAGHKFRVGVVADNNTNTNKGDNDAAAAAAGPVRPDQQHQHYALLTSGLEMVGADPNHARVLHDLLEELGDEELDREVKEKGVVQVFKERREDIRERLRAADPVYWDRFVESQEMARANVKVEGAERGVNGVGSGSGSGSGRRGSDETAVED